MKDQEKKTHESGREVFSRLGAAAALLLLAYSVVTMFAMVLLGGQPATAEEAFDLLQENRMIGLLRLDLLTVAAMPLYYFLYAGMCAAVWRIDRIRALLTAAPAFLGVTLILATPSTASMAHLADRYAAAATDAQKALYLAAGEAVLASDMWHGSGALLGGLLVAAAGLLVSVALMQAGITGKATSMAGILANGLDGIRMLAGLFAPGAAFILMAVAGPLYLLWFPLLARSLFQLERQDRIRSPAGDA